MVSGERRDATALHRVAAFCCSVQALPDSNQMLLGKPKRGSTLLGEWLCKFTHTANCYATDEPARVLVVTLTLALVQVT